MANPYYTFTPEFTPGTRVRSGDVNIQYAAIEDAFDALDASNPLTPLGANTFTTETGVTNGYVVAMPTTRTTETDGDEVIFIATHTNTAAATLEVDGLGSKSIVRADGDPVEAGDLTDGLMYVLRYDAANTRYQLMSPSPSQFTGDLLAENNLSDLDSAATARTNLGVDAAGTDNSTDVTLAGTPDYLTISGQEITRGLIDLTADVAGDLPVTEGGTGASIAADARTNLGVDAAGTDNSTDVTLTGQDYLTISSQEITANKIALDDLVDGTDGELITWDAAGAPAAVAVGTATQVLTSNGPGAAPTFQDAAAGGGLTVPLDNLEEITWTDASAGEEGYLALYDDDEYGDIYQDDVVFYLNFNGANGATEATDLSITGQEVSFEGNAQLDTTIKFSGTASLKLDGVDDHVQEVGDFTPDISGGDFTIEAAIRLNAVPTGTNRIAALYTTTFDQRCWLWSATPTGFSFSWNPTGVSGAGESATETFTWVADTWYEVALVRSGNTIYHFVDGVMIGSHAMTVTGIYYSATAPFAIGITPNNNNEDFSGYIDYFRITTAARWTANYPASGDEPYSFRYGGNGFVVGANEQETFIQGDTINLNSPTDVEQKLTFKAGGVNGADVYNDGQFINCRDTTLRLKSEGTRAALAIDGEGVTGDSTYPMMNIYNVCETDSNIDRRFMHFNEDGGYNTSGGMYWDLDFSGLNAENSFVFGGNNPTFKIRNNSYCYIWDLTNTNWKRVLDERDLGGTDVTYSAGVTTTWAASSSYVSQSGATASYAAGSITKFSDNANLTFGTGSDVDIDFDGTDFNIAGVGDFNLTGFTALNAGTVDADFDAVTATSYGGITEANLLDKSAAEEISGAWVFETTSGNSYFNLRKSSSSLQAAIKLDNELSVQRFILGLAGGTDDDFFLGRYNDSGIWQGSAIYVDGITGQVDLSHGTGSIKLSTTSSGVQVTGSVEMGASGPTISTGSGSPESVVTAPIGSLYTRTDGGAGTTLYVKESTTGSTGWVAK